MIGRLPEDVVAIIVGHCTVFCEDCNQNTNGAIKTRCPVYTARQCTQCKLYYCRTHTPLNFFPECNLFPTWTICKSCHSPNEDHRYDRLNNILEDNFLSLVEAIANT